MDRLRREPCDPTTDGARLLRCMDYHMSAARIGVIERYQELVKLITGKMPRLHSAKTPFLQEDTREAPARAPKNDGDFI